jgi:prophage regulatory protein
LLHTTSPNRAAANSRPFELGFLRLPALLSKRGRKRSSHFRDIKAGLFPPPVALGPRCSGWPEHEVDLLLRAQIAGASPDEIRSLVARLIAARAELMPSVEVA